MFRSPAGKSPLLQMPRLAGNSRKCKEPCRALRWKARPVCVPHRFPASRAVPLQCEPLSARPLSYIVRPLGKPFPSSAAVSPFLRNFAGCFFTLSIKEWIYSFSGLPLLQTSRLAGNSRKCKEPCRALRWKARPVCVPHRFPASRAVPLQREPLSARPLSHIVHPRGKPLPQLCGRFAFSPEPRRSLLHTFGTAHKNAFGTGKLCRPKGVFARVLFSHNFR